MIAARLAIPEVVLFEPDIFPDDRGHFYESFSQKSFEKAVGMTVIFVQDNHSVSNNGVLRGLHYQVAPYAQGKLVRVVRGAVFDVAVDIRKGSLTYGKWVAETLSAANRKQLWIPEGFAHGFLALGEGTEFLYKTTNYYNKESERAIRWDDPTLGITWPSRDVLVSAKDRAATTLQ